MNEIVRAHPDPASVETRHVPSSETELVDCLEVLLFLGFLIAFWSNDLLKILLPPDVPRAAELSHAEWLGMPLGRELIRSIVDDGRAGEQDRPAERPAHKVDVGVQVFMGAPGDAADRVSGGEELPGDGTPHHPGDPGEQDPHARPPPTVFS